MSNKGQLPRSTPESQGVSSTGILAFVNAAKQNLHLHSFMLLRHGHVIAEAWATPYRPEHVQELFSMSKSFVGTAIGLAVADGLLTVDTPVISFFPDDVPATISKNLAAMQVHHLLSLVTGHSNDTLEALFDSTDGNWVKAFLAEPVDHAPGAHFGYNSGASYMLSAIVHQVTKMTTLDYLQRRLFDTLGAGPGSWTSCPRGIHVGGWELSLTTEDVARFGQFYLQKGMWQAQQLLPEAWIMEATSRQVASKSFNNDIDWEQGYGYQFWCSRHNGYHASGAFGQFCLVLPDQDVVFVVTSGHKDGQMILDHVWTYLLSAMHENALSEDRATQTISTQNMLAEALGSLAISKPEGRPSSPIMSSVSGKNYHFDRTMQEPLGGEPLVDTMVWHFGKQAGTVTIQDARGQQQVTFGYYDWHEGLTTLHQDAAQPIAAIGAWIAEDTFQVNVCFVETPFCRTLTCQFDDATIHYDLSMNIGFGPTERVQFVGRHTRQDVTAKE